MQNDPSQQFLQGHDIIEKDQTFHFACHHGVPCFNACCSNLTLHLTPYDVLRLRRCLDQPGKLFIQKHGRVVHMGGTNLPAVRFLMSSEEGNPCPFVTEKGCRVYTDRPGACRTYPVGRASTINEEGETEEKFFMIKESHCKGFAEEREWVPAAWLQDQGLEQYNYFNDKYMKLSQELRRKNKAVSREKSGIVLLALFMTYEFQKFLQSMHVLDKVELSEEEKTNILQDEEAALEFGFEWVQLILFGSNPKLKPVF